MILSYHAMFIDEFANLYSIGNNSYGQLGVSNEKKSFESDPQKVMSNVIQTATGLTHTLAVTADNRVVAFGDNKYGQLGLGNGAGTSVPTYINFQEGGTSTPVNILYVECGLYHNIALDSNGHIWLWGNNGEGQCATRTTLNSDDDSSVIWSPKKFDPSTFPLYSELLPYDTTNKSKRGIDIDGDIYEISCGNNFTMLRINNLVWIWGSNSDKQIDANGGYYMTYEPTLLNKIIPGSDDLTKPEYKIVTSLAGDRFITLLTEKGEVFISGTAITRVKGNFETIKYNSFTKIADETKILHYSPTGILLSRTAYNTLLDESLELRIDYRDESVNKTDLMIKEKEFSIDVDFDIYDFSPGIKYDIYVKGWKYLGTTTNTFIIDSNILYNGVGRA